MSISYASEDLRVYHLMRLSTGDPGLSSNMVLIFLSGFLCNTKVLLWGKIGNEFVEVAPHALYLVGK